MSNILKLLVTAVLMFSSISSLQAADEHKMSMTDIKGKTYKVEGTEQGLKIEGLEGKIVFLEFFGHKCPPCLKTIPHLKKLQAEHKDKLAIVAIEVQGLTNSQLKKFAKKKEMNYTVVADEKAEGIVDYIAQRAEWQGSIPFLVAMDRHGNVQFVQAGMLPESSLEELIKQLDTVK
ncbi:thioredoxin family protein [hydrothermal vent metagenome]|uniref:Thioredoxin family protein n=1 Tax=hydrothermal vent metagenome TaxID=652676 RepID=A0A1W1EFK7_9ZZZZ